MTRHSPFTARFLAADPAAIAVRDEQGEHRYSEILAGARGISASLLAGHGSLGGQRVAILAEPGARFLEAFWGVILAGGAVVVLSPSHPARESTFFCDDAGVRVVLASRELVANAELAAPGRRVLVIEAARDSEVPGWLASGIELSPHSAALQPYTSGTTGRPKGAVLTHQNLAEQQALLAQAWGLSSQDVLLHTLPLHHIHGLCIALLALLGAGGCARMLSGFNAVAVWEGLEHSTVFMAVPTIYAKLLGAYDAAPPDVQERWARAAQRLRLATSGSAALPSTLGARWRTLTGRYPLERYGMTEIGVALSNPLAAERRPSSVGMPLPSVRTRIVDETGSQAETGELWVAGPSVFSGYYQREQATNEAFVEGDGERWFRTGDIVQRDSDGYYRILGRASIDILKSGGYKLSALEIEEVLREHPAVAEVAVIGLPDPVWGDQVVACVVWRGASGAEVPGAEAGATRRASLSDELRAFCKQHLAAYKVPKQIFLEASLPRNGMGKVIKSELVARYAGATPSSCSSVP